VSIGSAPYEDAIAQLPALYRHEQASLNLDLTHERIEARHVELLFRIIRECPSRTFNFTFVFNNVHSSPYFPAAVYAREGFALGLQPTDLAASCATLEEWFDAMKASWIELNDAFGMEPDFLGIDSSTAPLLGEHASLAGAIARFAGSFDRAVTTDIFTKITAFIKKENPRPVGLCGLMLPCLEDSVLASEYERGNFSIERNLFLSLHSGLGVDTYPIGTNESPERVLEILMLVQALSNKYSKPLSVRFVSDGAAKVGERTDFKNQYLADCVVRAL
jgi:uncharacterized protein